MAMLYQRPDRPLVTSATPRLASWDKAGSVGQQRLAEWLGEVDTIAARADAGPGPLAVELMIGLPSGMPITSGGRDLDNYLLPVVHRLGPVRVVAAFARKAPGQQSHLAIGPAAVLTTVRHTNDQVLVQSARATTIKYPTRAPSDVAVIRLPLPPTLCFAEGCCGSSRPSHVKQLAHRFDTIAYGSAVLSLPIASDS
jgi:hypothetical protein